jgi:serine/threonine-protein kinase RsbW
MKKEIIISSRVDELRKVEKIIDEVSAEVKLNEEIYGNVLIATLEAVNNAIVHGNKSDESKMVNVLFESNNEYLLISIEDQGYGFDYKHIPDPTSPENIENVNGRGVYLMEKLSDKLTFFDGGKKVEMIFKF